MFFRKKTTTPASFSSLAVDFHSHLIPGIDDGVRTLEESMALIRRMAAMGYRKIITTPHISADLYPNTREGILEGRDAVREQWRVECGEWRGVEIEVAAEYFLDENFEELLHTQPLLTLPGKRVLIEMAGVAPAHNLHELLFKMQTKGYRPVMAHPERYPYYMRDFSAVQRLKDYGCELQVNLLSLAGQYGSAIREQGFKIIKKGLADFLCTDLHRAQHADLLEEALKDKQMKKVLERGGFLNNKL
jgi:protein-tyrosine phosphatase